MGSPKNTTIPKPEIRNLQPVLLAGVQAETSLTSDRTKELWETFGPLRKSMQGTNPTALYSVEIYPDLEYFQAFDPSRPYQKWACIPLGHKADIPYGLEVLLLPAGMYAVFQYQGASTGVAGFYQLIFTQWLPESGYTLENRPHFAHMGAEYQPEDPESKEEIWIPIQNP